MRRSLSTNGRSRLAIVVCLAAASVVGPATAEVVRPGGSGIYWLDDGEGHRAGDLIGSSGLVRTPELISMWVDTDLTPGSVETVWWVIFNEPRACIHPQRLSRCGFDDLETDAARPSVQLAAGQVVGPFGSGAITGALQRGSTNGCTAGLPCAGLLDPLEADVHLLIRDKGSFDPSVGSEQLTTYDGGCSSASPCRNLQAAFHLAVRRDALPESADGAPMAGSAVVSIVISNFRYCRGYICAPSDGPYAYPTHGAGMLNPQGVIDVRPGDTVTWIYGDAWCDVAGAVPYCPGHNVVFEDGTLRSPLLPSRSVQTQTFSWEVPRAAVPGTTIPYYCDIFNHMNIGMTGVLRVVGS